MGKLVIVAFLKGWQGYSKGERAGFDGETAKHLQEKGFAEIVSRSGRGKGGRAGGGSQPAGSAAGGKSSTGGPPAEGGDELSSDDPPLPEGSDEPTADEDGKP